MILRKDIDPQRPLFPPAPTCTSTGLVAGERDRCDRRDKLAMAAQGPPEGHPDDGRTRPIPPTSSGDVTRPIPPASGYPPGPEPHQQRPYEQPYGEQTQSYDARYDSPRYVDEEPEPERRRGARTALTLIGGAVLGAVITLVVVALGTSSSEPDVSVDAAQIAALEEQVAERDARIGELEAQLAEAEAAAGEREEDIQTQRDALAEFEAQLEERSAALDGRSQALAEREARLEELERQGPAPQDPPEGDQGIEIPEIDTEQIDTFIDRLLERIRELFGG